MLKAPELLEHNLFSIWFEANIAGLLSEEHFTFYFSLQLLCPHIQTPLAFDASIITSNSSPGPVALVWARLSLGLPQHCAGWIFQAVSMSGTLRFCVCDYPCKLSCLPLSRGSEAEGVGDVLPLWSKCTAVCLGNTASCHCPCFHKKLWLVVSVQGSGCW